MDNTDYIQWLKEQMRAKGLRHSTDGTRNWRYK
jgi:hypothetical protein